MSLLTVVRHGQASFHKENYDALSPLGEIQARKLGEYWLRRGQRFDLVFYGPRERHIRTGEIIAQMYKEAGGQWPQPVTLEHFDEFPAEEVARAFLPILTKKHSHLAEWMQEFLGAGDPEVKRRALDRALHDVARRWITGEVSAPEIPSWHEFLEGVAEGLRIVRERSPKSSQVVVFTSSGPTAATARVALELTPLKTLDVTWMPRNASYSEFLFSGERFTMATFNCVPHLDAPELLTYR